MAKFMILYNSTTSASDLMSSSTTEQMKAGMDEWMVWKDEASKSASFEWGMPLQAVSRVSPDGAVVDSDSMVTGYSTMEGDKEIIVELLKTHPHLKRPGSSIDVLEMLSMPGM